MRPLLTIFAAVEAATGLALLLFPPLVAELLLGAVLTVPVALVVARVAGAGVLALSVACWFARNDGASGAGRGAVAAALIYNTSVVAVLAYAGAVAGLTGLMLWPAVVLHAGHAVWCVVCLRSS